VELVKNGMVIATVVTDVNGNYLFSNGPGSDDSSRDYSIAELMPDMEYIIRVPDVTGGSKQVSLGNLILTTSNADGGTPGTQADERDSDGEASGVNAEVTVLTTQIEISGANNHSFDFGFFAPYLDAALSKTIVSPTVPVQTSDVVTFNITVTNQGTDPLDS